MKDVLWTRIRKRPPKRHEDISRKEVLTYVAYDFR